ncbi:hypothetical protein FP368_21140 [Citrobacter freundii]|nr:hypothetical protein [Citrobacter freundii]
MFLRLWVRAPRTSILSIHLSRIKRFFAWLHGATGDHKRLIMTQLDLNGYTVLECKTHVPVQQCLAGVVYWNQLRNVVKALLEMLQSRAYTYSVTFFRRHDHGQQRRKQGDSRR